MKQSDSKPNRPEENLQDLEKAIQILQDKLDSLAKTLKNIKNQLGDQNRKRNIVSKRGNCIPLPYTFSP